MVEKCNDSRCPVHGRLSLRGRSFVGTIISAKMQRSAVVKWEYKRYIPKYERYEKKRTSIKVHNPDCINAKKGDIVHFRECRPLSKAKCFVIVKKIGKDVLFEEKEALLKEGKTRSKKKEKPEQVEKEEGASKDEGA